MPDIEYSFGTGESAPNVHHSEANVDVDGDGIADGVALDFDGDGRVDDVMWDSDGDGVADTAMLDLNDDGVAEDAYSDPTGQGTWNAHGQGGNVQQPTPAPDPQPSPGPTDGGGETDNGYEPYGADDAADDTAEDEAVPGELPGGAEPETDGHNAPDEELPDTGGDAADDTGSIEYEPRDDESDTHGLFDTLEDTPDVDRDALTEWFDDPIH